jgi:hypothetical protein
MIHSTCHSSQYAQTVDHRTSCIPSSSIVLSSHFILFFINSGSQHTLDVRTLYVHSSFSRNQWGSPLYFDPSECPRLGRDSPLVRTHRPSRQALEALPQYAGKYNFQSF